jgi:DNA repair protein RadA/Sms
MRKSRETIFVCSRCGNELVKWQGQCPACKEWNSLKEVKDQRSKIKNFRKTGDGGKIEAVRLGERTRKERVVYSSQIGEFNRVLGKGIVRGQVILFAGEPGIGKSTLLTQLIGKVGGLYVAGEESAEQIEMRVERLGIKKDNFSVLEENDIDRVVEYIRRTKNVYKIGVIDSIQAMVSQEAVGQAGSPTQIKEGAFRLINLAKETGVAMIIVGHITKEGEIAGPKLLEHMVDTVLYFEGERGGELRILRVSKNRFGPSDEVGIFNMTEGGLVDVREPTLAKASAGKVGSAITVVMEGSRPMTVEIQALVTESFGPMPKRVFSGIDYNRGQLLVAVTQKVLGMPLYKYDVFVAVTGGIRVEDTGADVAVAGAMYSSFKNRPIGGSRAIKADTKSASSPVLMGEVSLLGEVKKVRSWEKRIKEAKNWGGEVVIINSIRELRQMV